MLLTSTLAVVLFSAGCSPDADRPPALTFDKPVDYVAWYNEFVQKGKKDNALDLYKGLLQDEAGKGGVPIPEGPAVEQLGKALRQVWKAEDFGELKAYLQNCAPYIDTLKKAVQRPDYWQPAVPKDLMLMKLAFPGLGGSRNLSKAMLAQALMKQDRQGQALIDACRVVLQHAGHVQQHEVLIGELVSVAERVLVYRTAQVALAEKVLADDDIAKLYATLRRFDVAATRAGRWPYVEWATQLDNLQYVCPKGKVNIERWNAMLKGVEPADQQPPIEPDSINPKTAAKQIDKYFEGLVKILGGPLGLKTLRALEKYEQDQRTALEGNAFLMMVPIVSKAYQVMVKCETQRRGTLLALAFCGHQAKHGKWPESLAAIDAKLGFKGLKKLKKDPFSNKEFVYKLQDGRPVLYSVGVDGKDDGGTHDEKWSEGKDYVIWPYQRP